ncbi:MAG: PRC-barrel domain-containing protein [Nostocaceae cyanobacterium]|nr:PRC-barrel domain-containing protein [Nostocaceae cyanobacterium]
MALLKLTEIAPNYQRKIFGDEEIIGFSVYSAVNEEKIGSVKDILVDENQTKFRYLVVDLGFWIFGKTVVLPIGLVWIDLAQQRVYVKQITKEQAEDLPDFNDSYRLDYDYEERVRNIYCTPANYTLMNPMLSVLPYGPMAINEIAILNEGMNMNEPNGYLQEAHRATEARANYNYHHYPTLYEVNDSDHPRLRVYEKRLLVLKNRVIPK